MSGKQQFLQIRVGGQLFGIPLVRIRDVLKPQKVTKIPLAKPAILGFMNLHGKIVTAIDMKKRLAITEEKEPTKPMFVVVESESEFYSLKVDFVGDIKMIAISDFENNPGNMPSNWKELSHGIFKLDKELMLVLDVNKIVKF